MTKIRAAVRHTPTTPLIPVGLTAWLYRAECPCGWQGPSRWERVSAEDDSARHLLEVQS